MTSDRRVIRRNPAWRDLPRSAGDALALGFATATRDGVGYLPRCEGSGTPIARGEEAICVCRVRFALEARRIPDHQTRPWEYETQKDPDVE